MGPNGSGKSTLRARYGQPRVRGHGRRIMIKGEDVTTCRQRAGRAGLFLASSIPRAIRECRS